MTYKAPSPHQADMLAAIDSFEKQFDNLLRTVSTVDNDNGRRLSIARTNTEQGLMWLRKAVMKDDRED